MLHLQLARSKFCTEHLLRIASCTDQLPQDASAFSRREVSTSPFLRIFGRALLHQS
jgi:hypothetical protein